MVLIPINTYLPGSFYINFNIYIHLHVLKMKCYDFFLVHITVDENFERLYSTMDFFVSE